MTPDFKARKRGEPTMPIEERLMSRTKRNEKTGCIEWQGTKHNGYGRLIVGSRKDGTRHTTSAHRLSYLLFNGPIPDGYEVCHKCDNPACINPEHLFLGTRQDNVNDREIKGRNIVKIGEEQPRAKLTKKAVKQCRDLYFRGGISYEKLAKRFGVAKRTMMRAIKGITWKCVSYMPNAPKEDEA